MTAIIRATARGVPSDAPEDVDPGAVAAAKRRVIMTSMSPLRTPLVVLVLAAATLAGCGSSGSGASGSETRGADRRASGKPDIEVCAVNTSADPGLVVTLGSTPEQPFTRKGSCDRSGPEPAMRVALPNGTPVVDLLFVNNGASVNVYTGTGSSQRSLGTFPQNHRVTFTAGGGTTFEVYRFADRADGSNFFTVWAYAS